jgi:hypothetical protein
MIRPAGSCPARDDSGGARDRGRLPGRDDRHRRWEPIQYRFTETGRFLVICQNRGHLLNDWMFGFVNVVTDDHDHGHDDDDHDHR